MLGFFAVCLLTFLAGWLSSCYLLLAGIMDIIMIGFAVTLVRSRAIEEGRKQVIRLYLAWGIFVIVLTGMMIY